MFKGQNSQVAESQNQGQWPLRPCVKDTITHVTLDPKNSQPTTGHQLSRFRWIQVRLTDMAVVPI